MHRNNHAFHSNSPSDYLAHTAVRHPQVATNHAGPHSAWGQLNYFLTYTIGKGSAVDEHSPELVDLFLTYNRSHDVPFYHKVALVVYQLISL